MLFVKRLYARADIFKQIKQLISEMKGLLRVTVLLRKCYWLRNRIFVI